MTPTAPDWVTRGACRGLPVGVFYPERGGDIATPKRICATCPVRQPCLDRALDEGHKYGVFGGTSERQRGKMRRPLPRVPAECGTDAGYLRHYRADEVACADCKSAHAWANWERKHRDDVA